MQTAVNRHLCLVPLLTPKTEVKTEVSERTHVTPATSSSPVKPMAQRLTTRLSCVGLTPRGHRYLSTAQVLVAKSSSHAKVSGVVPPAITIREQCQDAIYILVSDDAVKRVYYAYLQVITALSLAINKRYWPN
jgi:hypothetical protein